MPQPYGRSGVRAQSPGSEKRRKHPVEGSRKGVSGSRIKRRWPRSNGPGHPKRLHVVTNGQSLSDRLGGVLFAAGIEHSDLPWHQQRRQRYVLGNHQVARLGLLGDVSVRHVRPPIDANGSHQPISRRRLKPLVGHQDGLYPEPPGSPKYQLLHIPGSGVCVNPDFQIRSAWRRGNIDQSSVLEFNSMTLPSGSVMKSWGQPVGFWGRSRQGIPRSRKCRKVA